MSRKHFKEHWKELVAQQASLNGDSGREEASDESVEDESDATSRGDLRSFVRRHRRVLLIGCLCLVAVYAAVVHLGRLTPASKRRPLYGRIRVEGVDVARGSIRFLPSAGNPGPAANTAIIDGEYEFTAESGPYSGPHHVLIDIDTKAAKSREPELAAAPKDMKRTTSPGVFEGVAAGDEQVEQPASENVRQRWEFEVAVPEGGTGQKDFDLSG